MLTNTSPVLLLLASIVRVASGELVTGAKGNATIVKDNPEDMMFRAKFPDDQFFQPAGKKGSVTGVVYADTNDGGTGVTYNVKIDNLPSEGGPFVYHIHQEPVPPDGNCDATLAHLDPFERGEEPPCVADLPMTCQIGDLSGKYGAITTTPFSATYTDDFTSTDKDQAQAFMGNLSVVVHFANLTRITCANFGKMKRSNYMISEGDMDMDM